jgi:uncharacterized protein with HEPN domain
MKLDDKVRLRHMLESAQEAISFLGDMTEGELAQNRMALNAIVRSVEIIGEAASQLTPEFRNNHPIVPWPKIVGMRNRLIHAYFDIDYELVFSTVRGDIPILVAQIKQLISEHA